MKNRQLTIFASGTGTNFKTIHQATLDNRIPATITALISNKADAGALKYAKDQDIRTYLISPDEYPSEKAFADHLEEVLIAENPDLIPLAGFLKKIPDRIITNYPGRIINIHPSLLPKYGGKGWYGMKVHQAVIENNEAESGCTVHYVTPEYDQGPVIAQKRVTVEPNDTPESLAKKVQEQEHLLYPEVIRNLLINREQN